MTWTAGVSTLSALGIPGPAPYALLDQPTISDGWNLSFAESAIGGANLYWTELGLLALPFHQHGQESAKALSASNPLSVTDTWFAQWNESPFDTILLDLWDIWRLTYATDSGSVNLGQTYALADPWSISFAENSTVSTTSSSVSLTPNDLWQLTETTEAATMFKDVAGLVDTWSITFAVESSGLLATAVTPSVDTWSITFTETSSVSASGAFVVNIVDTWSITFVEVSQLGIANFLSTADIWSLAAPEVSQVIANATLVLSDVWSLRWPESPIAISATPMSSDLVDTWTLATLSEVASVANVPTIPILTSDEWRLTFVESSGLKADHTQPPGQRRIVVNTGRRRVVVLE